MNKKKITFLKISLLFILVLTITGCKDDDPLIYTEKNNSIDDNKTTLLNIEQTDTNESLIFIEDGNSTVFDTKQKEFLYDLFKTQYLWYEQVPEVDYTPYNTPQDMIDALKYSAYDRWSFSMTMQEFEDISTQTAQGSGCYYFSYYDYKYVIFTRIDSPCDKAGIKRGDLITKINGYYINDERLTYMEENLDTQSRLTVIRGSEVLDINVTPSKYTYKASKYKIFTRENNVKVAHMIFNEFTYASADEIDEAFTYFKQNGVDELILDLRYNNGGLLATASILMDKIAGSNQDKVQMHLKWNDKNRDKDSYYHFEKDENTLDINRIFVLTTANTASASEVVINGLKPYMDVKLIGSKTHGKPVGMRGSLNQGLIYWLINLSIYNADGIGDFYGGIDVDCFANDNINYERNDENGSMLGSALYYIDNEKCR